MLRLVLSLAVLVTAMAGVPARAASPEGENKLLLYHAKDGRWCGLRDEEAYKKRLETVDLWVDPDLNYLEYDFVTIWFRGTTVVKIEEFFGTPDWETWGTDTYFLNQDGTVGSAEITFRVSREEYGTNKTEIYDVKNGEFVLRDGTDTPSLTFRRLLNLSSFPFFKVISLFQSNDKLAEACT